MYCRRTGCSGKSISILTAFLLLILTCSFPLPSGADTRNRDIKVFGPRSFAPYSFVNENETADGFLLDILKASLSPEKKINAELGVWSQLKGYRQPRKPDVLLGISFSRASNEIMDHTEFLVNTGKQGFSIENFLSRSSRFISGKDMDRFWFYIPVEDVTFSCFGLKKTIRDMTLKDVFGRDIVVRKGSEAYYYLMEHNVARRLMAAESSAEALYMILSGEADFALLGTCQGKYLLESLEIEEIAPLEESLFSVSHGLVVTRGNISLVSEILQNISRIRAEGTFDRIHKRWFSSFEERTIDPDLVLKIFLTGIIVIIVFLLWSFSLKKQVDHIVREREKIMDFTRDGIVAVDRNGQISLLNHTAVQLAGLRGDERGCDIDQCIPELGLSDVLREGEAVHDSEQNVNGRILVVNKAPVKLGEEITGAIATFRDMTEIRAMAQEITGVKMYVESLRVQNHEFLNKLQAIAGLIQLGKYNRAIEFISSERQEWQSTTSFVSEHIENFVVGGILVGKIGKCRELGIDFAIDPHSTCGENSTVGDQILVTVIGNLLENAIEAVRSLKEREPLIEFSVFDESGQIMISVKDNGKGIEEEIRDKIFQRGFSTKKNSGRSSGYGLYSIRMMVEALKGDIFLDSLPGEYTEFVVTLPNGGD